MFYIGIISIDPLFKRASDAGELIASGESDEGNIVVSASSVTLYLQNLNLSSKKNSKLIQEMMLFVLNMI